jgi:hypothetical protein
VDLPVLAGLPRGVGFSTMIEAILEHEAKHGKFDAAGIA